MVNFNAYLQSIANTYAEWWKCYTITDVVGQRDEQKGRSATLPRSPLFDFGLMVETVKQEKEEKTERLTVLEDLRKYADNHVVLIGRPGSGKSTALLRLLVETAQNHLEPRSLVLPGNALLRVYEAEPHNELIVKQTNLYVPVSWLLIIPTIGLSIFSFPYTHLALSWIPLCIGFHLGI